MKINIAIFVCFLCFISCKNTSIKIEAIDKELNEKAEYGIQYFEISDYKDMPNDELVN